MSACSRCGQDVGQNVIHLAYGDEERRAAVARAFPGAVAVRVCGQPLSLDELRELRGYYRMEQNGTLTFVESEEGA